LAHDGELGALGNRGGWSMKRATHCRQQNQPINEEISPLVQPSLKFPHVIALCKIFFDFSGDLW
jgi:hypothetical protein